MNKQQAISWCEAYQPQWPDIGDDFSKLAAPSGWSWLATRLPYNVEFTVRLTKGTLFISKADIFPPPPAVPPVPVHVITFIANIEQCKKREPEYRIITTNRDTFNNLIRDYPSFALVARKGDYWVMYQGVKVKVLNDDIHLITGFISEHSKCFADFLENQNRRKDFDSIIQTLIHTDD